MAVTITWNGDTTNRAVILEEYFKITERVFTSEEVEGCTVITDSGEEGTDPTIGIIEGVLNVSFSIGGANVDFICVEAGTEAFGETVSEGGTYFSKDNNYIATLTLPNVEEETKPLAEITYNGETIAQLNAGDKATIPCSQYNMSKDLVFKVNEVESKIPEGYIKPEGTLEITEHGTYDVKDYASVDVYGTYELKPLVVTENGVYENPDVDGYSKVTVNVTTPNPTPTEISTEAEMTALLSAFMLATFSKRNHFGRASSSARTMLRD
jgi:hypothetical protein